ncbi:hypothetical protein ABI_08670 [Asticcacaulis biprosthecium C19]|uniref:Uncharacterized protein n=1 Tax=Asticcacaulis biprosthecium C19 TaxID=715226 RepID=F4QGA4_9CAUL|nr:hypothetical protein ABI_08670 [Asticcacaulis biprosthecium C19]
MRLPLEFHEQAPSLARDRALHMGASYEDGGGLSNLTGVSSGR